MNRNEERRAAIADRIADYILANGLPRANLRPLAAAAGLSDRMLLYYFRDKEEILETALTLVAARLGRELSEADDGGPRGPEQLQALLVPLATGERLWPYMCVWLEMASLAARGDPTCRRLGRGVAAGFRDWIASKLDLDDPVARDAAAGETLRILEGAIVLKSVDLT